MAKSVITIPATVNRHTAAPIGSYRKRRVAAYARVSTDHEEQQSRPEFMRMVADMRAGEIDCIVVKDLSRLGRNYLEAGDYLEKIFPFFGVRFIAVTDGYDSINPNTAEDGLIVPLKNLINEAYAKDMSKKISTAIDIKQRQGKFIGSRAAYG